MKAGMAGAFAGRRLLSGPGVSGAMGVSIRPAVFAEAEAGG
jgi:hypothetical protein